ncbi:MAG: hypothetical protein [Thorarchaeia virus VerdaV2]|uniref:Uncharacterized protein n=1 Tax=Thorarchaeia virus VerdaV2 TaxID=3070171 RepID=A0AA35G9X1_9CAUD|nr:MAG: hypothetical protein QIT42_gp12 [Thorarchaeia virus VerdaV2]BDI54906.1 MAG: hypothetical protein [Thorarchaeia virus VerdaV2]
MVSFIKNSTNYGLFILEHAAGNDNTWIADGGINEADWDLYTEGTDGIHLPYAGEIKHAPEFEFDIIDFFMGAGADISMGMGHDLFILNGRYGGATETIRNAKMANLLLLYAKHLKASTEVLYLGYRKKGEVWEPFFDTTPATVYYLKGKLIHASYERGEDELFYNWKIVFRGVQ